MRSGSAISRLDPALQYSSRLGPACRSGTSRRVGQQSSYPLVGPTAGVVPTLREMDVRRRDVPLRHAVPRRDEYWKRGFLSRDRRAGTHRLHLRVEDAPGLPDHELLVTVTSPSAATKTLLRCIKPTSKRLRARRPCAAGRAAWNALPNTWRRVIPEGGQEHATPHRIGGRMVAARKALPSQREGVDAAARPAERERRALPWSRSTRSTYRRADGNETLALSSPAQASW